MQRSDTLVFLPTYNEVGTVRTVHGMIRDVLPDADILFVDDSSPDGTGAILDDLARSDARLHVVHRPGKLGIGSAHQDGIAWAYDRGYATLITMDSDLAHSPRYITAFIDAASQFPVVVGTRFQIKESLAEWPVWRLCLTHTGHFLTRALLGIDQDATGAFRLYHLTAIPREIFAIVRGRDYAFFFESLHVLVLNGIAVGEVPIDLPARAYGASKMRMQEVILGTLKLFGHAARARFRRRSMVLPPPPRSAPDGSNSKESWDRYWRTNGGNPANIVYGKIAGLVRKYVIKRCLDRFLARHFTPGATLLHAGCGGGQIDDDAVRRFRVTAIDISSVAVTRYAAGHGGKAGIVHADLLALPITDGAFDGLYNLGLMEHFTEPDIDRLLTEFRRVLKPDGKVLFFWPVRYGLSVQALKFVHLGLNSVLRCGVQLHPAEPSLLSGRADVAEKLARNGLTLREFYFGPRDAFCQAIVVAERDG